MGSKMRTYRIYAAGKITGDNWRKEIIPNEGFYVEEEQRHNWPIRRNLILGEHAYTGPYFVKPDSSVSQVQRVHGVVPYTGEHAILDWYSDADSDEVDRVQREKTQVFDL